MSLRRRFLLVFAAYVLVVAVGGAIALRVTAERNDVLDRQRKLIDPSQLDNRDRAQLRTIENDLDGLRRDFNITILATLGAAFVVTLGATFLVRRWVTRPIARIAGAVRSARAGKAGVIPPYGPPEIARIARDADAMRIQMNQALYYADHAREVVAQSASVVHKLRSELASGVDELPDNWTVAARLQSAEGEVAGDCYDVILLDPAELALMVVDISGHGAVPGIIALRCKELLRAGLRNGLDPDEAVRWAADQLDDLDDETFLSAFVAIVDLHTGEVRYVSAGHPPALLCSPTGVLPLDPTGPIVGPFEGSWTMAAGAIDEGDTLAIYTDGLVEVRNTSREEFGVKRLAGLVCRSASDEADAIAKRCMDEIALFSPRRLDDDATVVLLCRGPRPWR